MKKIAPVAAGSACPSYDDLIWFADTGDRERLKGHDPAACPSCSRHLDEYQSLLHDLHELAEPYADSQ
jgi:hypothetical protein